MKQTKKKSKTSKVVLLGITAVATVMIATGVNVHTLINNNGIIRTGKKAGANDAATSDVLEGYTFTSDTAGVGVAGSMSDYSNELKRIKLEAAAANKVVTIPLTDADGYYTRMEIDTTDVYNERV